MAQKIKFDPAAEQDLKKLDTQTQRRILKYLNEHIAPLDDPRDVGKQLVDPKFRGYWRYRVGDYRIICGIRDSELRVIFIGKRDKIYNK